MTYGALKSTHEVGNGLFAAAIATATAEIAREPYEPEAYFNRGQALSGLGRWEEAIADYEAALRLDASSSGLDPAAADDELFSALKNLALTIEDRGSALAVLDRYQAVLPEGRHLADVATWRDHVNGVETVWVRDRA